MNSWLQKLPQPIKKLLRKRIIPTFIKPMLATLTKKHFSSNHWIYERKFDGVRCLLINNNGSITIKSRNNTILNATYPELVKAAQKLPIKQIILDGEIVAFEGKATSFSKLQQRLGLENPTAEQIKNTKVFLYIFDIPYLDGFDLTKLPLLLRKSLLKNAIPFKDPLRYVVHKNETGIQLLKEACKKGWEGIIAKEQDSTYIHGRSTYWLKFKCVQEQEMIICGYTDPKGTRTVGFGALLLGYYKDGKLMYAGKVGTGYSQKFLADFGKTLKKIEISKNIFANKDAVEKHGVHFVKPILVGQFGFEEWTKDNKLRQGRFLGLRTDKKAKEVTKELAKAIGPEV